MPSRRGDISFRLNVCLIVISTFFISIRLYVRGVMTKTLRWDDLLAAIAFVVLLALSALEIKEVGLGAGQPQHSLDPETLAKFFSILPTMQLLYFAATGLVRLSIVAFLPRLNNNKKFLYLVWGLGFIVASTSIVCFMVELFECKHVPDLWDGAAPNRQCMPKSKEAYMFWTHAAIGVAVDVALLVVPIALVYKKMMFSRRSIKVMIVLSVGIFVTVTGIIRLIIIVNVDFSVNTTYQLPTVAVLTDLEGHVELWVSCFPALQPLMRIMAVKMGLRSKLDSSKPPYGRTGGVASSGPNRDRRGYVQSGSGSQIRIKDTWDTDSVQAVVVSDVEAVPMQLLFPSSQHERSADGSNGITKSTQDHSSADNSSDRDRKHTSLDQRSDGPRPPSGDSELRHWGINIEAWGLEARGITRVTASEEKVVEMTETVE
ncbi:hypothetical protein V502_01362 [Pseudogymnoascus sp. VKM F-4520 (FW-2644)]|nr:hypothetical protein V502_01362 [Pseudogymnoascus sp. VKM F-4520 (FW-2644)]